MNKATTALYRTGDHVLIGELQFCTWASGRNGLVIGRSFTDIPVQEEWLRSYLGWLYDIQLDEPATDLGNGRVHNRVDGLRAEDLTRSPA